VLPATATVLLLQQSKGVAVLQQSKGDCLQLHSTALLLCQQQSKDAVVLQSCTAVLLSCSPQNRDHMTYSIIADLHVFSSLVLVPNSELVEIAGDVDGSTGVVVPVGVNRV
jgi:hypothetical protein